MYVLELNVGLELYVQAGRPALNARAGIGWLELYVWAGIKLMGWN
jgi:hypothetical protein